MRVCPFGFHEFAGGENIKKILKNPPSAGDFRKNTSLRMRLFQGWFQGRSDGQQVRFLHRHQNPGKEPGKTTKKSWPFLAFWGLENRICSAEKISRKDCRASALDVILYYKLIILLMMITNLSYTHLTYLRRTGWTPFLEIYIDKCETKRFAVLGVEGVQFISKETQTWVCPPQKKKCDFFPN